MFVWLLFGFATLLALGWAFLNGRHRRDSAYRQKLVATLGKFPPFTKRKLLRLLMPTKMKDRWNHAAVIAGCCCIISSPVAIIMILLGEAAWWAALLLIIGGTLTGAYIGEAVFNFRVTGLDLPNESTPPPSESGDERGD